MHDYLSSSEKTGSRFINKIKSTLMIIKIKYNNKYKSTPLGIELIKTIVENLIIAK